MVLGSKWKIFNCFETIYLQACSWGHESKTYKLFDINFLTRCIQAYGWWILFKLCIKETKLEPFISVHLYTILLHRPRRYWKSWHACTSKIYKFMLQLLHDNEHFIHGFMRNAPLDDNGTWNIEHRWEKTVFKTGV